jgi:hypothetical protein
MIASMAKKKATGLPVNLEPLITSLAILVRHMICPQLGGPIGWITWDRQILVLP